jgi:signal peptidase II
MSDPQQPRPAMAMPLVRAGLILAAITIVADQASKWLLQDMLLKQGTIEVIPGLFNLVMVWNKGISFGMLGRTGGGLPPWALSAIAVVICIALFFWLRAARSRWTAWAIGLVIGGAIGNVVDRARWGAVFDFADFYIGRWHWPAFNVADAAIVIGVLMLLGESLMPGAAKERR